jgi:hypothetical protein
MVNSLEVNQVIRQTPVMGKPLNINMTAWWKIIKRIFHSYQHNHIIKTKDHLQGKYT